MKHSIKLIYIYYQVCELYNRYQTQNVLRFNHNGLEGDITDQELLTIYLFCTIEEEKRTKKAMHKYIKNHLHSWFPTLPSYQTFNDRLNRLAIVFPIFLDFILEELALPCSTEILLGDSFPIITCSAKRKAKVARELVSKDYCASKNLWYYGVRIHALTAQSLVHSLPKPVYLQVHTASKHDLEALKPVLETVQNATIALDKAYCDAQLAQKLEEENNALLFTPEKAQKNESEEQRQHKQAYRDVLSTAVAKVRQPVEALFSWLQRKTDIQNASNIRAKNGLLLHIFGKITAAFMSLFPIFNT